MRRCSKCGKAEPQVAFYRSQRGNICRSCQISSAVKWAQAHPQRKRESNLRYLSTPLGSKAIQRKTQRFRAKFPQKYAAYIAVQTAVRNGTLIPQPCEVCKMVNSHAHHDDYRKPLNVRWLCDLCHVRLHRAMLAQREA